MLILSSWLTHQELLSESYVCVDAQRKSSEYYSFAPNNVLKLYFYVYFLLDITLILFKLLWQAVTQKSAQRIRFDWFKILLGIRHT